MAKELRCGDRMPGCKTVIEGKDEQEVLSKAAEHARAAHDMREVTPELERQVRGAIHDKA